MPSIICEIDPTVNTFGYLWVGMGGVYNALLAAQLLFCSMNRPFCYLYRRPLKSLKWRELSSQDGTLNE